MKKLYTIILFFSSISFQLLAQTGLIKGKLTSENGSDVPFATIMLKGLKLGTVSNEKGEFLIDKAPIGKQFIVVSSVGYESINQEINVKEGSNEINLSIKESINSLSEVSVVGNIGITQVKPQSIQYNSKDLISQNGGTAGDILKAMPSVAMGGSPNHNRDIRFRGLGNGYTQVLINGQPVGVSGNNRESVLDLIPANQIESIEILSNPTADMVSTGVNGVVNIILKKGVPSTKLYDTRGRASFTADQLGGYNGSLGLSGRAKNFTYGASIDRLARIVDNNSDGDTKKYSNTGTLTENVLTLKNETKDFTNNTAKAFLGFNSKGWDIYTDYTYGDQTEDKTKLDVQRTFDASNKFKSGKYVNSPEIKSVFFHNPSLKVSKNWKNQEFQFLYNFNGSGEDKTTDQNEYGSTDTGEPILNKTPKITRNDDQIRLQTHLPSFSWSTNIFKKSLLKAGYQGFLTERNITRNSNTYNATSNKFDTKVDAKNNFEANEDVNAFFTTFQWNIEKLKLNLGYRHEFATIQTKLNSSTDTKLGDYSTPLPSLHAQYFISKETYISTSLGRRIRRPGFNDLNPFLEIKSPTEHKIGNPDLQPELAWAYEAGIFKQTKNFNIGVNYFLRNINNLIQKDITNENGIFVEKPINIRAAQTTGLEFIAAAKVGKWLNFNGNYSKFWSKILTNDEYNGDQLKDQFAWTAKLLTDIKLPAKINLQVISNWVGPKNTIQSGEGKVQFVDFGIQKEFGKGNLLFVRGTDIFDTLKKWKYTNTATQVANTYEQTQGRVFSVGASVNF
ncbi:MAG: TonB-dependent receptor [Arcicella sp.]|nr:TonB-dependent receptor [Arcicella sp.]